MAQVMEILDFMASMGKLEKAKSYCDYIAATAWDALRSHDPMGIIATVERVKPDLHPVGGYLVSTKKSIDVVDRNGNRYRVTIEDLREVSK